MEVSVGWIDCPKEWLWLGAVSRHLMPGMSEDAGARLTILLAGTAG